MNPARIAVLISGRGSNMQAIHQACVNGDLDAEVISVISSHAKAGGLDYARQQGLSHHVASDETSLEQLLQSLSPDWIALAGYMRILSATLVNPWLGRMINIHPSLLPKYPGLNTHARALSDGASEHGATVHFVTEELDAGPIIQQARVPVLPDDTADTLAARVLGIEHALYVDALRLCVNGVARFQQPA